MKSPVRTYRPSTEIIGRYPTSDSAHEPQFGCGGTLQAQEKQRLMTLRTENYTAVTLLAVYPVLRDKDVASNGVFISFVDGGTIKPCIVQYRLYTCILLYILQHPSYCRRRIVRVFVHTKYIYYIQY